MADVQTVVGRHSVVVVARRVVVVDVPGKMHADAVQAVDLVKNVDAADVGVWAKAERLGKFGRVRRIAALVDDCLPADWDRLLGFHPPPSGVDLRGWRLAENGRIVVYKSAV